MQSLPAALLSAMHILESCVPHPCANEAHLMVVKASSFLLHSLDFNRFIKWM